jgi:hypothetical protein
MVIKVETARSKPTRTVTGATAAQKLEARRLQMLAKQRERLEEEVRALESEVEALVRDQCTRIPVHNLNVMQELKVLNQ